MTSAPGSRRGPHSVWRSATRFVIARLKALRLSATIRGFLPHVELNSLAGRLGGGLHFLENVPHVDALRIFARVPLRESQIVFEHLLHLINVPLQRLDLGRAHHGKLKPEAGEDRPQVVAHACQHDRALLDVALDALAHVEEGLGGKADLARAADLEIRLVAGRPRPNRSAAASARERMGRI